MTSRHQPHAYQLLCFLLALLFLSPDAGLLAQPGTQGPQNASTKMTTQRLYYDPPNQDKVKLELFGEAITNSAAGALITGAKIRSYSVVGGPPQLTAETASCDFDVSTSQISSTNLLQIRTGDGNFYVEGVGFLWQKTTPDLTLSNHVHTIIRQFATGNPPAANTNSPNSTTDVYAEDATFDTKTGLIVYRDGVRVIGPQLTLTAAILTAQLSQGGANNQLDHIVSETNVVIDTMDQSGRKIHATSDKAVYTRTTDTETNELLTLSGNPRIETTNGWATADVFVMNRTTGKIRGSGNCRFHSLTPLTTTTVSNVPATPETLITADNFDYDMKSGLAVFRDNVRVDNPQIKLACEILTARLPETNTQPAGLNNIVAENGVVIDYVDERGEQTHAVSDKAVYSSSVVSGVTNKVLDLTGNPVIERTNGWIMADLITMDLANGVIRGEGNHHTIFKRQAGQVTKGSPPKSADIEIFSDNFDFNRSTGLAYYRGDARVIDPEMRLECRQIMLKLPEGLSATNHFSRPERIVADTNVIVDYLTEKGEKTHATGDKMVFTHHVTDVDTTNDVLELTGNPVIDMTNLKGETTHATGDKVTYTSSTAPAKTISLVVLSGRPRVERSDGSVMTSDEVIIYDRITGQVRGVGPQNHITYIIRSKPPVKTNSPPALSGAAAH